MEKFQFETWRNEYDKSPVEDFFDTKLNDKQLATVLYKIDHFKNLSILELGKEGALKKIRDIKISLNELRFKYPPIRMLGVLQRSKFVATHIFIKDYDGAIKRKEINIALSRVLQVSNVEKEVNRIIK